jgi:hypothetical protein
MAKENVFSNTSLKKIRNLIFDFFEIRKVLTKYFLS